MVLCTEQAPWSPMTSAWHCLVVLQCAGSWTDPMVSYDISLALLGGFAMCWVLGRPRGLL